MTARLLVVVSGLPASGKTTVGTLLSERLSISLIDKDAILESLFDSLGSPDREARTRLGNRTVAAHRNVHRRGPLRLSRRAGG